MRRERGKESMDVGEDRGKEVSVQKGGSRNGQDPGVPGVTLGYVV
jgi:hypothetical protein